MFNASRPPHLPETFREAPLLPSPGPGSSPTPGEVLLVNPFYRKDPWGSLGKHVLTPSQALTSIAAATPAEWTVRYWDENLLQGSAPPEPVPEVVGITVHVTFAHRAYELAAHYRALGCTVVLGGLHVSALPEEAAAHADSIVTGDGVAVWPNLLDDLRAGRLQDRYHGDPRATPLVEQPPVQRSVLPAGSFLTTSSIIATRGCHNRCDFCCLAVDGVAGPYQTRPVVQVADEIVGSCEPYSVFIDNNLGSRPTYLRELCQALEPLGHIWSAAVTLDVSDDPTLVREMAAAGCTGVFIGFESLSMANLASAGKRSPHPDDFAARARVFQDVGIQVNGSFVLGFDEDRPESFARLAEWIEDTGLECATFQILTPYPGTPLFDRLEAEGRILHRDWRRYDTAHAVFQPRHMEPEELEHWYGWLYQRLFSLSSIWRRRPRAAAAVPTYLAMSLLYKKCNPLWAFLIRRRLVRTVWRPLVELSRRRHLRYRRRLRAAIGQAGLEAAVP
jgi:radical SAM superfamily enzyme YgiQ (UPF0313 family)